MAVNGVNNTQSTQSAYDPAKTKKNNKTEVKETAVDQADTFEKSAETTDTKKTYKPDVAKLAELRASDRAHLQGLQNLVSSLMTQAGKSQFASGGNQFNAGGMNLNKIDSMWDLLVSDGNGNYYMNPALSTEQQDALRAKAQEDIGENGYYGVKQTSQRILDFAKAASGGDPAKIGEMRKMAQKAFDDVKRIMGGKLPEISQQTYDAVMKGFDEWEASVSE